MDKLNSMQETAARTNSRTSLNSLEKDISEMDIKFPKISTIDRRVSSSKTPTKKAKRVRFYRNGDRFYAGITIPVSPEKYRSFEKLTEDLTRLLEDSVKLPGAIRCIFSIDGKKITAIEHLEDGKSYVCSCNTEPFKKMDYHLATAQIKPINKISTRLLHPLSSPCRNGSSNNGVNLSERNTVVFPRIVTIIRHGTKPRKVLRLLLNKRNSPSFDHVLTAITQCVNLDSGCVRKVFTLSGEQALNLASFFGEQDIFFAYGNEKVGSDDFELDVDETKSINQTRRPFQSSSRNGHTPKMPVKSHNKTYSSTDPHIKDYGVNPCLFPQELQEQYSIGSVIGDGNFAIVLRIKDKQTGKYLALKIIDKAKCTGKEHYIDAEVRIMKKLKHSQIMELIQEINTTNYMYLALEYVSGGDLFDAIARVTRFSEKQAQIMMKNLASAIAYLHNLKIVHRDIKPENLLVELDKDGWVLNLKLADFGLACEVDAPLLAVCGTPTYVAPEILMENGYGLKIDVWAAGIILYILLCGFPPFASPDNQQEPLFDAILSGVYEFPDPYWTDIGTDVRDLIANMLQSDPNLRFSSEDVLDHYWIIDQLK